MFPDLVITYLPDRRGAKRIRQELSAFPDVVKSSQGRFKIIELIRPGAPDIPDEKADEILVEARGNLERCLSELYDSAEAGPLGTKPGALIIDASVESFFPSDNTSS